MLTKAWTLHPRGKEIHGPSNTVVNGLDVFLHPEVDCNISTAILAVHAYCVVSLGGMIVVVVTSYRQGWRAHAAFRSGILKL